MSKKEVKQLKIERDNAILERDTAIFVAKERLDIIERIKNQKEIFELRYLKADKEIERLNNIINGLEKDMNRDDLSYVETQYVLDKIKELKGEDKE